MPHYLYKTEPTKEQEDAVYFVTERFLQKELAFAGVFYDMGLGKSKICIDVAANLVAANKIDAMLIVAPNGVHQQWIAEEFPKHCPCSYQAIVFDGTTKKGIKAFEELRDAKMPGVLKVLAINVEAFSRETYVPAIRDFMIKNETLFVMDEADTIGNPESKRSFNIVMGLSNTVLSKLPNGKSKVLAATRLAKYRIACTGTPISKHPFQIWNVGEFLRPNIWGHSYAIFKIIYGLQRRDVVKATGKQFNRPLSTKEMSAIRRATAEGINEEIIEKIGTVFNVSEENIRYIAAHPELDIPYKNMNLLRKEIEEFAIIRRKEDCMTLPEKMYEKRYVLPTPEILKAYKQFERNAYTEYNGAELTANNCLTIALRLAQITSGFIALAQEDPEEEDKIVDLRPEWQPIGKTIPKIEAFADDLETRFDDSPILCFSRFVAEMEMAKNILQERYPEKRIGVINQSVTGSARTQLTDAFKAGDLDILIGSTATLGVGWNFQEHCHNVVYLSNDFRARNRMQSEDRIYRRGQTKGCLYVDYVMPDTVDMHVLQVLQENKDLADYFKGGKPLDYVFHYRKD